METRQRVINCSGTATARTVAQMEKVRDAQRDRIKSFGQNTFEMFKVKRRKKN